MRVSPGDVDAALARELELWEAYRTHDRATLERLIDPLALDVGPGGMRTRDDVLAAVERVVLRGYALEELVVRRYDTLELVAYRATVDGSYDGAPFKHPVVFTASTWMTRDGRAALLMRVEAPAF